MIYKQTMGGMHDSDTRCLNECLLMQYYFSLYITVKMLLPLISDLLLMGHELGKSNRLYFKHRSIIGGGQYGKQGGCLNEISPERGVSNNAGGGDKTKIYTVYVKWVESIHLDFKSEFVPHISVDRYGYDCL